MKKQEKRPERYVLQVGMIMTWLAVGLQFYLTLENRVASIPETIIRFFSFFTILTNTLVALCFTLLLRKQKSKLYPLISRPEILTAVAVYITVVGMVYQFALRHIWNPEGLQFLVDELLHTVIPLYFVVYWLLFVPKTSLQWKHIFSWLLYPAGYLVYILIRGKLSGFYPYYFIDLNDLGFTAVLINSGLLFIVFIFFSMFFIATGKWLRKTLDFSTLTHNK